MTPNPWMWLRSLPHVRLHVVALPEGLWGATDGRSNVWVHAGLSQAERRSTLAHELHHLVAGHEGHQPPAVEWRVREATAAYLLPDLEEVRREVAVASCLQEAAEALWVDEQTLADRLGA